MERLRYFRKKRGLSQKEVADYLGITAQAYGNYELSKRNVSTAMLKKLAWLFDVSFDELLKPEEPPEQTFSDADEPVDIEIIASVRAGFGGIAETDSDGTAPAFNLKNPSQYRFFRVTGDSMEPHIKEGDLALVHIQSNIESGQIAVVLVNDDEGTIKKVKKYEDHIELISFNEKYAPRKFGANQFTIWGRVIETVRPL